MSAITDVNFSQLRFAFAYKVRYMTTITVIFSHLTIIDKNDEIQRGHTRKIIIVLYSYIISYSNRHELFFE